MRIGLRRQSRPRRPHLPGGKDGDRRPVHLHHPKRRRPMRRHRDRERVPVQRERSNRRFVKRMVRTLTRVVVAVIAAVLVGFSFATLAAADHAGARAGSISGTWSGQVNELGAGAPLTLTVTLHIAAPASSHPGTETVTGGGTTCTGALRYLRASGALYSFIFTMSSPSCVGGPVALTLLSANTIRYLGSTKSLVSSGVLTRQSVTTPGRTVTPGKPASRLVVVAGVRLPPSAGNPQPHAGDGGPAVKAPIVGMYGVAVDGTGDLFFGEFPDNTIRKANLCTGVISTIAGNGTATFSGDGGPATAAGFDSPWGI